MGLESDSLLYLNLLFFTKISFISVLQKESFSALNHMKGQRSDSPIQQESVGRCLQRRPLELWSCGLMMVTE